MTAAVGDASHTEGIGTIALSNQQHVQGRFNITDETHTYAHIVGNGKSLDEQSNAHTLDWQGNAWFAGDITVGENKDNLLKEITTTENSGLKVTNKNQIEIDDDIIFIFDCGTSTGYNDEEEERLEGDGAEFYILAPTPLSFRSDAPLNELQEVQINGVTVDPSNYTLEEGSTIVTFPIDYLKTLDVGEYEVTVASESKSVKGGFTVAAPELNEHGFYYNQPYGGFIDYLGGVTAVFIHEGETLDVFIGGTPATCSYTLSGNNMTVNTPTMGVLNCTISDDGKEVYCTELSTSFVLANESIVADDDFLYVYEELLGGYSVTPIDITQSSYGAIKTGIYDKNTVAIPFNAFYYANNLVVAPAIPNTIKEISRQAFYSCSLLTQIVIPNSVENIGQSAFGYCSNLTVIIFEGTTAQWNAITKGDGWNQDVPATHVQCSDGTVEL